MQHGRMFANYSKRLTNKIWQLRLSINTIVSYYSNFHATAASRRWRVLLPLCRILLIVNVNGIVRWFAICQNS